MTDVANGNLVVRALEGDVEVDAFFTLAAATFPGYHRTHCTPLPGGSLAAGWRRFVTEAPSFEPTWLRGAFVGDSLVGGYIHEERWLHVAGVRLRSSYVGAVVTDPAWRGRGVASALMRDGTVLARERGQALIVLRGIADFYGRFGYADVMEVTNHAVPREAIESAPRPACSVRTATLHDAPALLELYERHYGGYTGSYDRTLVQQEHLLRHRTSPPLLAIDEHDAPCGYLLLPCGRDQSAAVEVAADSWPAALALLQQHAKAAPDALEIRWPAPIDSPTYYHLADNLPVRSETHTRPDAGFLARLGNLSELFAGLVHVWSERWRRRGNASSKSFALDVDGERCVLEPTSDGLRPVARPSADCYTVRLKEQTLIQLVFGFRPVDRLLPDAHPEVREALTVLFPTGHAWYPASNRC